MAGLPSSSALLGTTSPREENDEPPPASATTGGGGQLSLTLRLANPQETLLRVRFAEDPSAGNAASLGGGNSSGVAAADDGDDGSAVTEADSSAARAGSRDGTTTLTVGTTKEPGVSPAGATAAPSTAACVGVTVNPNLGRSEGEWVRLEGKEDEFLRQPGERHRLPDGLLRRDGGGDNAGDGNSGSGGGGGGDCAAPVLLHQQGDVAWVQVPLGAASADRVRAAVVAAAGSFSYEALVVTVRLFLVMGEGEEERGGEVEGAGGGGDVWMPIAVRFPLSKCLP